MAATRQAERPHRDEACGSIFERAGQRLSFDVPPALTDADLVPDLGDHSLDPASRALFAVRPIRPAAVLVPIVEREEPTILLTQRSAGLPNHAGQISFPGGKIDREDESPLAAALREAEEEIGLDRRFVHPIGYLDLYLTTLGFRIVPTLARIEPGFRLALNRGEVEDAFEVPVAFLMEAANHQRHSREWQGLSRTYYAIPFGERYIWGVTAGILRNMYERLFAR